MYNMFWYLVYWLLTLYTGKAKLSVCWLNHCLFSYCCAPVNISSIILNVWLNYVDFVKLKIPPFLSVSVMEVECVWEGCKSETLRNLATSLPEEQCLTILFKGGRKSLDLQCDTKEEAQHWVSGIRTLQGRVNNMTQKEKLDKYPSADNQIHCTLQSQLISPGHNQMTSKNTLLLFITD